VEKRIRLDGLAAVLIEQFELNSADWAALGWKGQLAIEIMDKARKRAR